MLDYQYLTNTFNKIGIVINEEKNQEIIYFFPLVFDKKSCLYSFKNSYSVLKEPLGIFLIDFINLDFNKIKEFKDFFLKYPFTILDIDVNKSFFSNCYTENEFNEFINELYISNKKRLQKVQYQVDQILDYCIINPKKKEMYSPLERFLVLQTVNENLTLLRENKIESISFYQIENKNISNKTEKELYKTLAASNNKVIKINIAIPYTIESLIYFILSKIMEKKLFFKVCKNCNKYFISNNSKVEYCNNIAPNSDKTCIEIGRKDSFQKTLYNDLLLKKYYKIYHQKQMLAKRNPDILKYTNDYEKYKKIGKSKVSDYKSKKISEEEFNSWLDMKK